MPEKFGRILCAFILIWPTIILAEGNIRMYKINKKEQQTRINFGKSAHQDGCHNLRFSKSLYRVALAGYAWCSIYSEDDCEAQSIVPALWEGGSYHQADIDTSQPQTKLYPGSKWLVQTQDNVRIRSWFCQAE